MDKLSWSALEYEPKERGGDWFWALGVIVAAGAGASVIYNNYFFAALLILGGFLLGFFAMKEPELVEYELGSKGLKIRDRLYPYENTKAFFVQIPSPEHEEIIKPMLFVKTERPFLPVLSIPIEIEMAEKIHARFAEKNVPEEEMKEHVSEKIMDALGF
ncbi:MAG TPA: hypothetical protein VJB95_00245 [Candidatus Paceibacterota bacterium]